MSNPKPPQYPLSDVELPSSFQIKQDDLYASIELEKFLSLTSDPNKKKKRAADEQQNLKLNSDIKRRLTIREDSSTNTVASTTTPTAQVDESSQNESMRSSTMDIDYLDGITEDDSLANQNATVNPPAESSESASTNNNISNNGINNSELPLPSPSASPKHYGFGDNDDAIDEGDQESQELHCVSTHKLINLIDDLATTSLSRNSLNNLVLRLISKADRSSLSDFRDLIDKSLKRDFLMSLPLEVAFKVLKELDYKSLNNILLVSKAWNGLIGEDFWKNLLEKDNFIDQDEELKIKSLRNKEHNYYQKLYIQRFKLHQNWTDPNFEPKRITIAGHGANVVTCLQFDDEKIISGADDKMINIYEAKTGKLVKVLQGHEGGVWALKYIGNQIVTGSTDRSVRVWNLKTGECTHIFKGHTSTIRCMEIVTDEETGKKLIITGSRDSTLHVWRLPDEDDINGGVFEEESQNPYFVSVYTGHTASVRAVAGHGNLVVSGSYDHTVRVWNLKRKRAVFVLKGHTDRIYSTILDVERNRCISASMDSSIRVWDLSTGKCIKKLNFHTSLVGLLGLSSKYLISAATDGTLRAWDPEVYTNEFTLHHDNHAAITTFDCSPNLLVSGSEGQFNLYDLRKNGKLIRSNLLSDCGQIWSTKFSHSKCVVAVEKNGQSFIEILDFSQHA